MRNSISYLLAYLQMKEIIVLLLLLALSLTIDPCLPFGLRLNYGRSILDPQNPQRLALRFNTRDQCSHIEMLINKYMIIHCPVRKVQHIMKDGLQYTTYIHTCSLTQQIDFDTDLEYNLFDLTNSKKIFPDNTKIHIKNPHKNDKDFTFLHVADWGPVTLQDNNTALIVPINPSVNQLVRQGKVDCVIVNGDIGYELNSNAEHHELTMKMIEEVASRVPIIFNRGNHEENGKQNKVGDMFNDYFEIYDLNISNATGINVGPVFFAIIDPANMLLPRKYITFTEESLYSSLTNAKAILQKASKQGKTIVGLSHYPLVCGYPTVGHCIPDQQYGEYLPLYVNLKDFYTLALKYRMPLMLSGHVHAYERTYPFISGYRTKQKDPKEKHKYIFDHEFFVQVVEGVSGSNGGLDGDYKKVKQPYEPIKFVASHAEQCTGYGLLHASKGQLKYEHFSFIKGQEKKMTDSFVIEIPQKDIAFEISSEL